MNRISAPRSFNPGKGHPREHLAYLSKMEMEMLRRMTDGTVSRGPKGLPSFVNTGPSDSMNAPNRTAPSTNRPDSSGREGGGGTGDKSVQSGNVSSKTSSTQTRSSTTTAGGKTDRETISRGPDSSGREQDSAFGNVARPYDSLQAPSTGNAPGKWDSYRTMNTIRQAQSTPAAAGPPGNHYGFGGIQRAGTGTPDAATSLGNMFSGMGPTLGDVISGTQRPTYQGPGRNVTNSISDPTNIAPSNNTLASLRQAVQGDPRVPQSIAGGTGNLPGQMQRPGPFSNHASESLPPGYREAYLNGGTPPQQSMSGPVVQANGEVPQPQRPTPGGLLGGGMGSPSQQGQSPEVPGRLAAIMGGLLGGNLGIRGYDPTQDMRRNSEQNDGAFLDPNNPNWKPGDPMPGTQPDPANPDPTKPQQFTPGFRGTLPEQLKWLFPQYQSTWAFTPPKLPWT